MTSPIPTVQVLLDDGSGTYPTDVTSRVQLGAGVSVSGHGRTDEFTAASAATFTCTLRNDDGGLTAGAGGFGLGPFGFGGFGTGANGIYPGQRIRYKETKGSTTTTVFTGVISGIDLGWSGGTAKAATVTVTAVDGLAALARKRLRSMLEQEILLDSPAAYYTLAEATGSTSAGDTSGKQASPLTITGTGAALTFGTGTGPGTDGLTATQFFGGQFFRAGFASAVTVAAIECYVSTTSSAPMAVLSSTGGLLITVAGGTVTVTSTITSFHTFSVPSLADGLVHQLLWVPSVGLYVDGVLYAGALVTPSVVSLGVGGSLATTATPWTGAISHVAVYTSAVSGTRVSSHYGAASGVSESTAARFARIASYVGATTATTTGMSGQLMAAQSTSGASAFDALQACADAEGGVFYCRGDGVMVLQGRGYRAMKTTPTLTVALKDIPASSMVITQDTQQILNSVTVTRTGGAAQLVKNAASVSAYGLYEQSLDLAVADDQSALSRGQWLTNAYDAPTQRLGSMSVNLLTSASAEQIFTVDVGDRWALSGMPSQTWTGFGDLSVEGWSRTLTVTESGAEWSMTMNLLPWVLFQSGIYDNAGSLYDDVAVYA